MKVFLANERLGNFPLLDVIWILNALISFQLFIYRFFANANLHMNICKYLFVFIVLWPLVLLYTSEQLLMEAVLKMFVKCCR